MVHNSYYLHGTWICMQLLHVDLPHILIYLYLYLVSKGSLLVTGPIVSILVLTPIIERSWCLL